jgi:hypothetical protein
MFGFTFLNFCCCHVFNSPLIPAPVNKMAGDIAMSQVRASVAESVGSIKAAPNVGRV